jgi:hypothetical protein
VSDDNPPPPAEERIDWVKRYNTLVEEAKSIGLEGVRPVTSRFRDTATGAKRCQALESSIKARREGLAAAERQEAAHPKAEDPPSEEQSPPANQESETMSTATKKKTAAKKTPVKRPAKAKTGLPRGGIIGDFDPNEGSNQEKALKVLAESKNKFVAIGDVLKAVYGNKDNENRVALTNVIRGIELKIEENFRSKYKIEREGRGDEAKLMLKVLR